MKLPNTFYLLIVLPVIGFSQKTPMLNDSDIKITGEIEEVEIDYLNPRMINDTISYFNDCGLFGKCREQIFYNKEGKISKIIQYDKNCNADKLEIEYIWQYHYFEGKLDSIVRKFADIEKLKKGFKELKYSYEFVNDSITYEFRQGFTGSHKRKYKITENEKFKKTEYINEKTDKGIKETCYYDSDGRIKKFDLYDIHGTLIKISINEYKSESDKLPNINYLINLSNDKVTTTEKEFDKKGNEIKKVIKASNGNIILDIIYEYEYDEKGNWIEKRRIANRTKKLLFVKKRKIKYRG